MPKKWLARTHTHTYESLWWHFTVVPFQDNSTNTALRLIHPPLKNAVWNVNVICIILTGSQRYWLINWARAAVFMHDDPALRPHLCWDLTAVSPKQSNNTQPELSYKKTLHGLFLSDASRVNWKWWKKKKKEEEKLSTTEPLPWLY